MKEAALSEEHTRRVPTGSSGLDIILHGGWLHGGTYRVTGSPGTGKTILGNPLCFSPLEVSKLRGGPQLTGQHTLEINDMGIVVHPRLESLYHRQPEERLEHGRKRGFHVLFGPRLEAKLEGVEAIVDNIVFLRYVELRSHLYRMLSILKMRESDHESSLREFSISTRGIDVAETFESAEAILTGQARPLAVKQKRSRRKKMERRPAARGRSRV